MCGWTYVSTCISYSAHDAVIKYIYCFTFTLIWHLESFETMIIRKIARHTIKQNRKQTPQAIKQRRKKTRSNPLCFYLRICLSIPMMTNKSSTFGLKTDNSFFAQVLDFLITIIKWPRNAFRVFGMSPAKPFREVM